MTDRLDLEYKWLNMHRVPVDKAEIMAWRIHDNIELYALMFGQSEQQLADMLLFIFDESTW